MAIASGHAQVNGARSLRVSSYVIGAPLRGQPFSIMLHGITGALDKMPVSLGNWLIDHRGAGVEATSVPADEATREVLLRRGYLTHDSADEERTALVAIAAALHDRDLAAAEPTFVIVPTYTCNLRCAYCFQDQAMHAGRGKYSAMIDDRQIDQVFRVVDEFSHPGAVARALGLLDGPAAPARPPRTIGLFGGEPLADVTVEPVRRIVASARERGITVWAITNGVDLDCHADVLGPDGIDEVQVTIDGMPATHNRRRIGPHRKDTFETIVENVNLALAAGVRVSLRTNVDQSNIDEVAPLADLLHSYGWDANPNFSAAAAVVTPEGRHGPLVTHADLVEVTDGLRLRDEGDIGSYDRWARNVITRCVSGSTYPFEQVAFCSAEVGQLIFDPLGDIYSCWDDVGVERYRVAQYDDDGLKFDTVAAGTWLARFPGAIEECSRCPYALIHTSGCGKHARDLAGTVFANACATFQELFPTTLSNAWEELEADLLSRPVVPPTAATATPRRRPIDVPLYVTSVT